MKERIEKHLDNLFADIYETKQLRELKEEIGLNLMEKINDFIVSGDNQDLAFEKAVTELGDMSELIEGLKKASDARNYENDYKLYIDKKHIIGYLSAGVALLFGLMVSGYIYLQQRELFTSIEYLIPFILVTAPIAVYFGLTQETRQNYGMKRKRALTYSLAAEIFLLGLATASIELFQQSSYSTIFITLMPFVIVAAAIFTYLGLTEKSRRKMNLAWQKEWVDYYSDPRSAMVRGGISGALWIFAFAAFLILGFTWTWKWSWIVFIIATGFEPLIEAFFAARRKH